MEDFLNGARLEAVGGQYIKWTLAQSSGGGREYVSLKCSVHADWFDASVTGDVSYDRLDVYFSELEDLLALSTPKVVFINEYGNVRIECNRGRRGNVVVSGVLSKSMGEDDTIEFELETDIASLDRFRQELLRQMKR